MNTPATNDQANEQSLVQLYMTLMGTTEAHARSVFMYLRTRPEELALEPLPSLVPIESLSAPSAWVQ